MRFYWIFISLSLLQVASAVRADSLCDGVVIRQVAPPSIAAGTPLQTQIRVFHTGDCELREVEILDYLPQNSKWLHATPEPQEYPGTNGRDGQVPGGPDPLPVSRVRWVKDQLSSGEQVDLEVHVEAPVLRGGWIRNTVCVSARGISRKCDVIETFVR